jgi:peptidoglycan/LPS O-acetylase OafA/YrhL
VAAASVVFLLLTHQLEAGSTSIENAVWSFTSLFIVGQDIVVALDDAKIWPDHPYTFLVPQAWSLGIELTFYVLIALLPFHRLRLYVSLVVVFGLIRIATYQLLGAADSAIYYLSTSVLVFFFIGSSSYQLYALVSPYLPDTRRLNTPFLLVGISYALLLWLFFHEVIRGGPLDSISAWEFYACSAVGLPIWWHATRYLRFDNLLGNLSYPVYIVHGLCRTVAWWIDPLMGTLASACGLLVSLVAAGVLLRLDKAFDQVRERISKTADPRRAARLVEADPAPVVAVEPAQALVPPGSSG